MAERTSVVNWSGDHEETILQLAKHLGSNKIRRKLFNAVYGRGSRPRSRNQLMAAAGIKSADAQQAQNALDHLAKYGLIVRIDNDGSVKDRARFLYRKDPNVRAYRAKIIKYADDPRAAATVPTKRRPSIRGLTSLRNVPKKQLKRKKKLKVLYLTADADKNHALRVDTEMQRVQEAIRGSRFRDNVELHYRPAAGLKQLIDGLNDHRPQIVHFSGHGFKGGLITDSGKLSKSSTQILSFELLAKALSATDSPPRVIVLNSCESSAARKAVLVVAKVVVSMSVSITDVAATAFAQQFYAALASGQSIKKAFEQGKIAVEAVSLSEANTPELFAQAGVDPSKVSIT
jgi:CHAT domain